MKVTLWLVPTIRLRLKAVQDWIDYLKDDFDHCYDCFFNDCKIADNDRKETNSSKKHKNE